MEEKSCCRRFRFMSEASWLNARRARDYPIIFLVIYAIAIVFVIATSHDGISIARHPVGEDFMDVWAAGKMSLEHRPAEAYDYKKHFEVQAKALPWKKGEAVPFYGWHYPPVYMLVATALATMPYLWALFVWMATSMPAYLMTLRAIMPGRVPMTGFLAFTGTFMTLGSGQNSFLTTALFGSGLYLLKKRPVIAGVLLGLLCYKPQFGIVLPLALVLGCHWRTIISAGLTVGFVCALSWLAFGVETWQAFFHSLPLTSHYILEQGPAGWEKNESIFSAIRMLGGGVKAAYAGQILEGLLCVVWIFRSWRSAAVEDGMKYAILVTSAVMTTPYLMDYDLTVMILPMVWLTITGIRDGFRRWEKFTLVIMFTLPILCHMLGKLTGFPFGPAMMLVFLFVLIARIGAQLKGSGQGADASKPVCAASV